MNLRDALLLFLALIVALLMLLSSPKQENIVAYDCRLAEISPDIPVEVKELCRQRRESKNK